MSLAESHRKKPKSPGELNINLKTSVTCTNVPEGLFDATTVKKHFSKFGRVQKIRLFPKRSMCIIEYDQPMAAERAVLNAGAFDGFMFDVTRTRNRIRRKSKKDDDPDWVPDSDVEEELNAMSGASSYRILRGQSMDVESESSTPKTRLINQTSLRKSKLSPRKVKEKPSITSQQTSGIESPVLVKTVQTSLSTAEAAAELHQLRSKVSKTPDEQWRALDARDRILRGWGGAGSRVKVGGATIGTCPDMCPEKELLHRQAEHQVMTLETVPGSDGLLEPWRAVKQYSRSSADQEIPMCYELRPASVLMRTCSYLLHEIADTTRQVTLADWFHFMWDRLRSIRKDITQQALCCADSIRLVEMCARFHAHCAARLADLEHTQFDQKLNTDNLTKCLQTLKHMYNDVGQEKKPNEAEFRGYIALLNLGDSNFWWEIKQLPREIQKSNDIIFAIQIFNALDNNNYVRFFRLIKEKATYLQACILLRYFNDVRARGLARMVKAYAPRGGSRFPAEDLMKAMAFESIDNMKSFISHYGLRLSRVENIEIAIILDRHQFIEDSDPYPITRAIELIESKRKSTVCEVIAGGEFPKIHCEKHNLHSSFDIDGKMKETAVTAEDQGYNTINDTEKDIYSLKTEIHKLAQEKSYSTVDKSEIRPNLFIKPDVKMLIPKSTHTLTTSSTVSDITSKPKLFSFTPAIPVASTEIIKNSPEKVFEANAKNAFSFSKPQVGPTTNDLNKKEEHLFTIPKNKNPFQTVSVPNPKNVFSRLGSNKDTVDNSHNIFSGAKSNDTPGNVFGKPVINKQSKIDDSARNDSIFGNKNVFATSKGNIFTKTDNTVKFGTKNNIFAKPVLTDEKSVSNEPSSVFGSITKFESNSFLKPATTDSSTENPLNSNTNSNKLSPGSIFRNASLPPNKTEVTNYSIFKSKNKAQTVADNLLHSINNPTNHTMYNFEHGNDNILKQDELKSQNHEKIKEDENILEQKLKDEEIERLRQEEEKLKEESKRQEELRRLEELKMLEENQRKKREEERKQIELKQKLEDERKAELQRKAEEEKNFQEFVEKESTRTTDELIDEVINDNLNALLKEENEKLQHLVKYADVACQEILKELTNEICKCEMRAEKFWTEKTMKKWFHVWRRNYIRNCKRRRLLDDTPVWLTEKSPIEEALNIRRSIENVALKNMKAIHKGYNFIGELHELPLPDPYNIMDLIRSPLLKRMKQINYPYDKCFFWKATLVLPEHVKWIYKKIHLENWLMSAFSDKEKHESENLIHVSKQSWNHLLDFAISICLTHISKINYCADAMEGTNGLIFYFSEKDRDCITKLEEALKHKYQYQVIPVAIVMAKCTFEAIYKNIEELLSKYLKNGIISAFKFFIIDPENLYETLNNSTKRALKWMAKKFPQTPPLEIDSLKSICQRYLGNEIWCKLKIEHDCRMKDVIKDLNKLIACYNIAVDKLSDIITNEDHFNYTSFPLEFKKYLDAASPYPKPYEFITSNVKTSENALAIKNIMTQLKLPIPCVFNSGSANNIQHQIRSYCYQIGWFNNPEEVVCKVITGFPNPLFDVDIPDQDFNQYFARFNLIDILNVIVYEKITRLDKFDNRFAIYEKSMLKDYCKADWLYDIDILHKIKHKAIEYEDDVDYFVEAKRRKLDMNPLDYLMLEDKDTILVEESIKAADRSITKYNHCTETVIQLELQLEEGKKKSMEFENMLKAALSDMNL